MHKRLPKNVSEREALLLLYFLLSIPTTILGLTLVGRAEESLPPFIYKALMFGFSLIFGSGLVASQYIRLDE